jgi:hypothetical protein
MPWVVLSSHAWKILLISHLSLPIHEMLLIWWLLPLHVEPLPLSRQTNQQEMRNEWMDVLKSMSMRVTYRTIFISGLLGNIIA